MTGQVSKDMYDEAVRISEKHADQIDTLEQQLAGKNETIRNQQDELEKRRAEMARLTKRASELDDLADEMKAEQEKLSAQIEEMSVSPLDLVQQQRLKALIASRGVVEETSSSNVFSKSGKKVSLAGVVSTAHFIITGERDYVTAEGEYVLDDTRRARPAGVDAGHTYTEVGPGGPAPHSDLDQPGANDAQ